LDDIVVASGQVEIAGGIRDQIESRRTLRKAQVIAEKFLAVSHGNKTCFLPFDPSAKMDASNR
jgi:hypothetical protein